MTLKIAAVLALSIHAAAQFQDKVPLPTGVYTVENLVDEFRAQLKTKMDEINKNYYPKMSGNVIDFYNDNFTHCSYGGHIPKARTVATVSVSQSKSDSEIVQTATYSGCKRLLLAKEVFRTSGQNLQPMPIRDLWYGKANFSLGRNEREKVYTLVGEDNIEYIRVRSYRTEFGLKSDFWIVGKNVLRYEEYQSSDEARVIYNLESFHHEFLSNGSSYRININFNKPTSFRTILQKSGQLFYYADGPGPLPLVKYNSKFSEQFLNAALSINTAIVREVIVNRLPPTKFVSSGVRTSKLLDELKLNFTRLSSNIELQEVKSFILQTIGLVESGMIEDKRPTK